MAAKWTKKDLLGLENLSADEIGLILETADSFKEISQRPIKKVPTLRGQTVVLFFFEPSTRRCSAWTQWRTNFSPYAASLCAISFSWCGNIRSTPPVWMSIVALNIFLIMAEHSICQPGLPLPKGVSQ